MVLDGTVELVALGACAGAQALVMGFAILIGLAYRERALLVHAAATLSSMLALALHVAQLDALGHAFLLATLALAGLHLRDAVNHAGALRQARRWLMAVSLGLLPALALLALAAPAGLLWLGLAAWLSVVVPVMVRAWPQSQPWVVWLVPGLLALMLGAAAVACDGVQAEDDAVRNTVPPAALLAAWSAAVYLATVWRSRLHGETRVRVDARTRVDPLTGLATPGVLAERIRAARSLLRRYGHPSVLLVLHVDGLDRWSQERGQDVAEAALLAAASRVRQVLGEGDVAARLPHWRLAVLAEGVSAAEASANIATRILAAGLRQPLPGTADEFLNFRIVLAALPAEENSERDLLHQLNARLNRDVQAAGERRIHAVAQEELRTDFAAPA